MPTQATPTWLHFLPLAMVVAVLIFRMARPQRISLTRMWVVPIVLAGIAAFAIYGSAVLNPAPWWQIVAGLAIGAVAGIPVGLLRGAHTSVRPTDRPGVMELGTSWITAAIYIAAFGLRALVRAAMPQHGGLSAAVGDGLLAFAVAYLIASYVAIYRKYEANVATKSIAPGLP